jgi:hypothetical protein
MRSDVETPPEVWGSGRGSGSTSGSAYYQICNKCGALLNADGKCPKGCNSDSGSGGNTSGSGGRKCPVCQSQMIEIPYTGIAFCPVCSWMAYGSGSGSGNPDNGWTSGGGEGNNEEKEPEKRHDCSSSATANADRVQYVIDRNTDKFGFRADIDPDVHSKLLMMKAQAGLSLNEYSYIIDYRTVVSATAKYISSEDGIQEGSNNKVNINPGPQANTLVHTHPQGQNPAPSPRDITSFFNEKNSTAKGLTSSVIFAHNGSEYVITVDDQEAVDSFLEKLKNPDFSANFIIPEDQTSNGFVPGSTWEQDYQEVYNKLWKGKGGEYSDEDAQAYALAYLMDKHDTGIKIYKRKDHYADFKELNTARSDNNKYTPRICP